MLPLTYLPPNLLPQFLPSSRYGMKGYDAKTGRSDEFERVIINDDLAKATKELELLVGEWYPAARR